MAVRDDFAPGEVLTAGDLNDTFASKADASAVTGSNLLYNGAMQVAQRGTSTAGITAGGYYTADRWNLALGTFGTFTQSVEADGPSGSGLTKSIKMLCTTADASPAAGDYHYLYQTLEGQDVQRIAKGTASAQQLTLSFWVKSNKTGTYVAMLTDDDNGRTVSASYTISASATWERKTITFPADTTGTLANDNGGSLSLYMWLGAGTTFSSGTLGTTWAAGVAANYAVGQTNLAAATNNYWQITGVQLEVGPVATSFEFKSYGQELRECQRYYQKFGGTQTAERLATAFVTNSTTGYAVFIPKVTMRTNPTHSRSGTITMSMPGIVSNNVTGSSDSTMAPDMAEVSFSISADATNFVAGRTCFITAANTSSSIALSAEL